MRRQQAQKNAPPTEPVQAALLRARKARRRGDLRAEINALRLACLHCEYDAALWTLLGAAQARANKMAEAIQALRHATWLRQRDGDTPRATITRLLLERVSIGKTVKAEAA